MRYLRSVDLEAVRATAARSFHLTRAPEPSDPLATRSPAPEPPESVVVSFPKSTDRPATDDDGGWERRPLAPVIELCEHYRHREGRPGLRVAAFRACSCDWVERPKLHRPKHAKCASEPAKPRRRRASRVRAYVSHPGGDLAPLALAVRSWMSVVAVSAPDGGMSPRGPGLEAVA
ncbi:hypothetical protein [Nocardiopsis sp. NRRL B-16309]|uniref:hypothetical protein n=1 Tax=Nocardiopsis sp. NRRL B-16309 TaxID=1519494 RepID=UPI0006AF2086|nr:hypothetical protein [Nocardiopsis sp. NRRL B-16309]KOX17703.1 hypothetical protein ADL05_08670 [Nocardiopsis sp. NRRL B-16309]